MWSACVLTNSFQTHVSLWRACNTTWRSTRWTCNCTTRSMCTTKVRLWWIWLKLRCTTRLLWQSLELYIASWTGAERCWSVWKENKLNFFFFTQVKLPPASLKINQKKENKFYNGLCQLTIRPSGISTHYISRVCVCVFLCLEKNFRRALTHHQKRTHSIKMMHGRERRWWCMVIKKKMSGAGRKKNNEQEIHVEKMRWKNQRNFIHESFQNKFWP